MALHDIGDGILEGDPPSRPGQERILIPFPEGVTTDEAFVAHCIERRIKAQGADIDDPWAKTALLNTDLSAHIEEIGGRLYVRYLSTLDKGKAHKIKNRLASAVEVARRQVITKDNVLNMMTTSVAYPSLDVPQAS